MCLVMDWHQQTEYKTAKIMYGWMEFNLYKTIIGLWC